MLSFKKNIPSSERIFCTALCSVVGFAYVDTLNIMGNTVWSHKHKLFLSDTFCYKFLLINDYAKSYIFWDINPCSPLKVNRRFGGTCYLHLQSPRIRQARNQREADGKHCPDFGQTTWRYIPEYRNIQNIIVITAVELQILQTVRCL
jgi:hypothetical protein